MRRRLVCGMVICFLAVSMTGCTTIQNAGQGQVGADQAQTPATQAEAVSEIADSSLSANQENVIVSSAPKDEAIDSISISDTQSTENAVAESEPAESEPIEETAYWQWQSDDLFAVYPLGGTSGDWEDFLASETGRTVEERGSADTDGLALALNEWPEVAEISAPEYTAYDGDYYFLILPRYEQQQFTLSAIERAGSMFQVSRDQSPIEYNSQGKAFVVGCMQTDIYGNLLIETSCPYGAVNPSQTSNTALIPLESLRDGNLMNLELTMVPEMQTSDQGVRMIRLSSVNTQELQDALNGCLSFRGSAGASLKMVSGVANLLYFCRNNVVDRLKTGTLEEMVNSWYQTLPETSKQDFLDSRAEIVETGDMILAADPAIEGNVADSGVKDMVDEMRALGDCESSWNAMKAALEKIS